MVFTKSSAPASVRCKNALTNSLECRTKVKKTDRNMRARNAVLLTPGRLSIMSIHTPPGIEALLGQHGT